jgi:hypothetical protein
MDENPIEPGEPVVSVCSTFAIAAVKQLKREYIYEQLGFIQLQAQATQVNIELGDDAGLFYSVMRLCAFTREMAKTAKELQLIDMQERIVAAGHDLTAEAAE